MVYLLSESSVEHNLLHEFTVKYELKLVVFFGNCRSILGREGAAERGAWRSSRAAIHLGV